MQKLLTYHVVVGEAVFSKDLKNGEQIKTVDGREVTAAVSAAGVKINDASVTTANVDSMNGVVHIIDTVLMPIGDEVEVSAGRIRIDFAAVKEFQKPEKRRRRQQPSQAKHRVPSQKKQVATQLWGVSTKPGQEFEEDIECDPEGVAVLEEQAVFVFEIQFEQIGAFKCNIWDAEKDVPDLRGIPLQLLDKRLNCLYGLLNRARHDHKKRAEKKRILGFTTAESNKDLLDITILVKYMDRNLSREASYFLCTGERGAEHFGDAAMKQKWMSGIRK